MFIRYQIENRLIQAHYLYTLHFGSREFMRNLRTKVSQAYDGRLIEQFMKIMGADEDYLDSRKKLNMNLQVIR